MIGRLGNYWKKCKAGIMNEKFEQYEHHGKIVTVIKEYKGRHRELCLCYSCALFKPGSPDNCPIANLNYAVCVAHGVTLPVLECPKFIEQ